MSFLKHSPLALLGRVFMASLFVGTIWMAGGCEFDERGHDHDRDHDRHVEEIHVDHDHDQVDRDHHY